MRRQTTTSRVAPAGSSRDERLDPFGHELGMTRHRAEGQVLRDERQLAQEVQHVGLLARALAAEHVRVDDDHASSS